MGTPIAFTSGSTNTFNLGTTKRATIALNPATSLTSGFNWFNGVDVSATQYLIYSDTFSQGQATIANARPTAWTTPDLSDASLLALINTLPDRVGLNAFTDINVALEWLEDGEKYFLIKGGYNNIVTNGLVLNLDAGWASSYPGSGTVWTDLSGNGDNGTLYNGVGFSTNGGGSLNFDGSDDYVETTNTNSLGNFTAEVWFYPTAVQFNAAAVISTLYPGTNSTVNYAINWDGGIFRAGFFNGNWHQFTIPNPVLNQWNHYVLTYNGSIMIAYSGSAVQIGSLVTSETAAGGGPTRIGRRWDLADEFLGQIAIARVYNRALSTAEIQRNYDIDKTRFGFGGQSLFAGTTLYYDFSKASSYNGGSTMNDLSGNGFNATVSGGNLTTIDGVVAYNCTTTGRVASGSDFIYGNNYTVFAWARILSDSETSTWRTLFRTQDEDHPLIVEDGTDLLGYYDNNGLNFVSYGLNVGTLGLVNKWVLYTIVGNNGTSQTLYINDGSTNATVNVNCAGEAHDAWGSTNNGSQPFGYISNCIAYSNTALTQAQVKQYYDATKQYYGYTSNNLSTNGLVFYVDASNPISYPGSGTVWYNLVGNGLDASLTNGPTYNTEVGGNISLDGSDDLVVIGHDSRISFSTAFTQVMWVKFNNIVSVSYKTLWGKPNYIVYGMIVEWYGSNPILFDFTTAGSSERNALGLIYPGTGWVMIAHSYNKDGGSNNQIGMVRGGATNTIYATRTASVSQNTSDMIMGGSGLEMQVGMAMLYNRGLTVTELENIYNNTKSRFGY
jgi:hypothetical protein